MHGDDSNYPDYVKQFALFYSELEMSSHFSNSAILKNIAWDFALFAHAVTNKAYQTGLESLKKIIQSLNAFLYETDTQTSLYDNAFKLYKFIIALNKQFEIFMQKKKQMKTK